MYKSIKILSVLSVGIAGASLVLAGLFMTVCWEVLCIVSFGEEYIDIGPVFPIGSALYIIGCLIFALVLFVNAKFHSSIKLEIVSIVFLSFIFPFLSWILGFRQEHYMILWGSEYLGALAMTESILILPIGIMKMSSALSLVACGMRIAEKTKLKKTE